MRDDIDEQLARISEQHHGVFSLEHAESVGADHSLRRRRMASGLWIAVGAAGYRFRGSPLTWRGQLQAALWDAGPDAVISHGSAAQLKRFPSSWGNPVEILVPRALDHACTIARVHQSRRFELVQTVKVQGFPVVAPADTIVHLAPRFRFARMEWLLDEVLAAGTVELAALQTAFAELSPGCRGMRHLRAILDDRRAGPGFPLSKLERLFEAFAEKYHLPPLVRQAPVPGREERPERVDYVWRDVRIIVELDSRRWHTRKADFERDHERDLDALAVGYPTARVTWLMLTQDPEGLCARLLDARRAAA